MKATGRNVIVKLLTDDKKEQRTEGGIIIPGSAEKEAFQKVQITSIGNMLQNTDIREGTEAMIHRNYISHLSILEPKEKLYLIHEEQVQVLLID